ncbi:MlaE family ABC transporter permease [Cytophaga hutchinsonii]|jgi:phospholipid/cholesterol/gamma-HCH transport system permease protein|uniref:ABC transporter, permease n=1 Tax=Cytophaga hutchinsonii (strain ATCC 33406 / DSM 1761 / CIP 103989 / NBRC 15051 / NCIMB 9469 / D465) TaxID=269798 RepID=A0A6N4SV74_CYTH3|nr:ABC transporter permease [Cytophaga hutchinsonii]ABG60227.1 ABC transporter, permease [Cytophaga hutchinsonii ATCC 33406]SFX21406.1 phospholipid/cholesterol/gamma-HCH transport system permease protein [Cytophaga hutchinsonii ATCC 33406]
MTKKVRPYIFSKGIDDIFKGVYDAFAFVALFFKQVFKPPFNLRQVIDQCYEVGIKSLPLITLTGFVTGLVFTKQSRPSLEVFGATSWLPSLISIALVRALGPLVTALICAGKVGSSIGAELGSMKVTEQIDAMEVSAINPFKYLVVTRVLATTFMVSILSFYCSLVGLLGAFVNVHANDTTSFANFFQSGFSDINFIDIFSSVTKSLVFGFTIGIVGCYKGFNATQGTRGVGKAANQAVVTAMFLIFVEEIVIVQVSNWIRLY